ncbi:L-aminopeptidase/D-esterase-like protein [Caulobacter ginsengisoli]|uniref:L-aminopeptidase/D-esterase-like protein n=1 Tax=Caulobacter ginsengisoli TaxID=400775 RepID=A0ABU0IZ22_9CAUL|nr:P1 family peptidase [Caulobacter ginsengisoli]MDQ0466546.1 L-aminopeptidase/D-esterase-like protein [Caulobacter ginsengisoli]
MSARPGPRNLITDVPGLAVGQAQDERVRTGVTVILPDQAAVCACDVRGGGPGTRETDALTADTLVDAVDAVVLSGGSSWGLAAGDGAAAWLGARGRGFAFANRPGVPPSPMVPAAILYDLSNGGDKAWGEDPPYRALAMQAINAAGPDFALGTAGAGYGAMAGMLKGGTGSASIVTDDGITVGAIVAVNSFGSVVAGDGRTFWATPYEIDGEFGGLGPAGLTAAPDDWGQSRLTMALARANTTIACVATDAALTPAQARRIAIMAQDGLARSIRPVHAPTDGDVVFVLSTARRPLLDPSPLTLARIGGLAADTLARAVARGVYEATPWPGSDAVCWRR